MSLRYGLRLFLSGFASETKGNMVMIGALLAPIAIGVVALGTTYHATSAGKSRLQDSLDGAVLAGAAVIDQSSGVTTAASKYLTTNFSAGAAADTAVVSQSYNVSGGTVEGRATGRTRNPFGGILGLPEFLDFSVAATAATDTAPVCLLGMSALDKGAFDMNGTSRLDARSCAVQVNSASSTGFTQEGTPYADVKQVRIRGGYSGTGFSNRPVTGASAVADPFAATLANRFPMHPPCASTSHGLHIMTDTMLMPGTYCGGLHVNSQARVTLTPGIYVMDGGPLWVNGGATLTGSDVMIAFTGDGSTLYAEGNSVIKLTSPSSGIYKNIQFFQDPKQYVDPKQGLWFSVGGGRNGNSDDTSKMTIDGMIYVPTQQVWIYGNVNTSINSPSMAVVTEKLWIQGKTTLTVTTENKRNLAAAWPTTTVVTGVRLLR